MTQSQELRRIREVTRIGQEINHDLPKDLITLFENLKDHIGSIFNGNHALLLSVYQPQMKTFAVYQTERGHIVYKPDYEFEGASRYIIANKTPLFIRQRSKEVLPYKQTTKSFVLPPYIAGVLSDPNTRSPMKSPRLDDVAYVNGKRSDFCQRECSAL